MRFTRAPDTSLIPGLLPELSYYWMDFLDGEDLARVGMVSKMGRQYAASTIFRRVFALFRWQLRSYDDFTDAFGRTGSVIGGLAALCILFPDLGSPPSHVHIYSPRRTHADLVNHLVSAQGFKSEVVDPDPRKTGVERHMHGVLSVWRLTKGRLILDLVQSTNSSPLYPITSEWCSGLYNYIGISSYMSAYAPLIREGRTLLNPARLTAGNHVPRGVRKNVLFWAKSGWNVTLHWKNYCGGAHNCEGVNSMGCAVASRFFGDRFCIWGTTSLVGEVVRDGERDPSEKVTVLWWRGGRTCRDLCSPGCRVITPGQRLVPRSIAK